MPSSWSMVDWARGDRDDLCSSYSVQRSVEPGIVGVTRALTRADPVLSRPGLSCGFLVFVVLISLCVSH